MPDKPNDFTALMDRVAQGDQQAAAQLLHRYGSAVIMVIRQRLDQNSRLRSIYDTDDFAQSVWSDFFAGPAKCNRFATPVDFVKYLTGMSRNQVRKAVREQLMTQKRDLCRSRHLSDPHIAAAADAVADPAPTPAQYAVSREEWEGWLKSLTSDQQRLILMVRAGFSREEIAGQFCRSLRTIERMVDELRLSPPPEPIANL